MTQQVRVLSPSQAGSPISIFGRSYAQQPGTVLDVPSGDAGALAANGWFRVALSGTTAQRPAQSVVLVGIDGLRPGLEFFDSTLGRIVVYDGLVWRDPATGGAI